MRQTVTKQTSRKGQDCKNTWVISCFTLVSVRFFRLFVIATGVGMKQFLHILLIEDDPVLATQLEGFLSDAGHIVDLAPTGKDGLRQVANHCYDVVILDLSLPDTDGMELCQHIKQNGESILPVLMLTARTALSDKLAGFAAGTDDYVTKPYQPDEVLVRCLSLARRRDLHQAKALVIGEMAIDLVTNTVSRQQQVLHLSATDKAILIALAKAHPMPLGRLALIERVWGNDIHNSDVLKSHIYTIRQQLDKPFEFPMLKTIHGVGFGLQESA